MLFYKNSWCGCHNITQYLFLTKSWVGYHLIDINKLLTTTMSIAKHNVLTEIELKGNKDKSKRIKDKGIDLKAREAFFITYILWEVSVSFHQVHPLHRAYPFHSIIFIRSVSFVRSFILYQDISIKTLR